MLEFRILGPLHVLDDDRTIEVAIDEACLGVAQLGAAKYGLEISIFAGPAPIAKVAEQADFALQPVQHIVDMGGGREEVEPVFRHQPEALAGVHGPGDEERSRRIASSPASARPSSDSTRGRLIAMYDVAGSNAILRGTTQGTRQP